MEEKILTGKKRGMRVLLCVLAVYVLAIAGCITGIVAENEGNTSAGNTALLIVSFAVIFLGWLVLPGLKVLKPQEAFLSFEVHILK